MPPTQYIYKNVSRGEMLGAAVSMAGDGSRIAVGAPYHDGEALSGADADGSEGKAIAFYVPEGSSAGPPTTPPTACSPTPPPSPAPPPAPP